MSAPEPGSREWLSKVTASKAAAILGASPHESPYSMWHLMKGLVDKPPQTIEQGRGHYLEPSVLAWWRDQHPEYAEVTDHPHLTHPDYPWAAATPDLAATGPDTVLVEAKTAADANDWDKWGRPGTDEIPVHYLTQCYFALALSGAARAYVPVLGPYLAFTEFVVEADEGIQSALLDQCEIFYHSLHGDTPPPLDDHTATLATLKRRHPDIDRGEKVDTDHQTALEWLSAHEAKKSAEARLRAAQIAVLDQMGTAQYLTTGGTRVGRRQASGKGVALYATAKPADLTEGDGAA